MTNKRECKENKENTLLMHRSSRAQFSALLFNLKLRDELEEQSTDHRHRKNIISAQTVQVTEFYVRNTRNIWKFERVKVDYQVTGNGQLIPRPVG